MGKVERFCIFAEKICDMTISFILKRSKTGFSMDDTIGGATIYVRLRDGRLLDSTASTGETVNPLWWDAKREEIKANIICDNKEKAALNEKLQKEVIEMSEKISSSVNSEIAKQLRDINLSSMPINASIEDKK